MRNVILALGLLLTLAWAQPVEAAITIAQSCTASPCNVDTTGVTRTIVFDGGNIAAGNTVIVISAPGSSTATVSSLVGCSSEAGEAVTSRASGGFGLSIHMWMIEKSVGGCDTVTLTHGASVAGFTHALVLANTAASDVLDAVAGATDAGGGTSHPSGLLSPSEANTIVISASRTTSANIGAGTHADNFTEYQETTRSYVQYWIQTTATDTTAEWTSTGSNAAVSISANFKAAEGDPPPPSTVPCVIGGGIFRTGCGGD